MIIRHNHSKLEAARIRQQLAIRRNEQLNCWEVFTTIHGSHIFRWFRVTAEIAKWYLETFPAIKQEPPVLQVEMLD